MPIDSVAGREAFARVFRLRFGVPSVGSLFAVRLARFGLAITRIGPALSIGLAMFVTAVTSVGNAVDEIAGFVNAVCGWSNGDGASIIEAVDATGAITIGS